ncbi:MAG: hypothetical protein JXB00_00615 [Bacteroidales bacterium]|nr:hypothetical protein [Bacteroidales bacterium]
MKKTVLIFFVLISFSIPVFCNNIIQLPYYPKYKETITRFLEEYKIPEMSYAEKFILAKKPDGWHALIINQVEKKTLKDELYWSREKNKYIKVDFEKADQNYLSENQSIIEDWYNNYFTGISPYWGYAGWDKDVIDEYANKQNLSDTLLNALARAYASFASNLLNENTGFSLDEYRFNLPKGQNALTKEQLEEYRKYEHKSIDTYYKLWELNPSFETFVSDIFNVYSNEVMNCYLTLLYHQNEIEALKEIKPGLYDSFYRDMAKRYLASCDSNAILIVNGDMDTYPLLYIQQSEGFRKDVTVINISLLASGRYISHLFTITEGKKSLKFGISEDIYKNESKQVFYIKEMKESVKMKELISFVLSTDPKTKLVIGEDHYDFIPSKTIEIEFNSDSLPGFYRYDKKEVPISNDTCISIKLDKNYLFINHFCFLDILNSNFTERPVYFAVTVSSENYLNLDEYLLCEGLAYKIMPEKLPIQDNSFFTGYIDTDILYKKLTYDFFKPLDDSHEYFDNHKKMVSNYRNTYSRLIEKLIIENKKDSALKMLEYFNNYFPSKYVEHDLYSVGFVESYYKLNQIRKADGMAYELFTTSSGKLKEIFMQKEKNRIELMREMETIRRLTEITKQFINGSELNEKIETEFDNFLGQYEKIN